MDLAFFVLGISFLIGFLAMRLWTKESPQWQNFPLIYGILPAIICIAVALFRTGEVSLGDFNILKFDPLYIGLAIAIPVAFYAFNLGIQKMASVYTVKSEIEWGTLIPAFFINVVILIVLVSGEEIGWRGFLQTDLINAYGSFIGIIILGLVWGIWHAPIALRGHNLKSNPVLETFVLYPYMCVCYAFPLAFLTIQSGSLLPALCFHAVNNTLGSLSLQVIESKKPRVQVALNMLTGTLLVVIFTAGAGAGLS